jgi:hypothetical protein
VKKELILIWVGFDAIVWFVYKSNDVDINYVFLKYYGRWSLLGYNIINNSNSNNNNIFIIQQLQEKHVTLHWS